MLLILGVASALGLPVLTDTMFERPAGLSLAGIALILSGRKALRAGRSMIPRISRGPFWRNYGSTLRLEDMNPHERLNHAKVTGWAIVVIGIMLIAGEVWLQLAAAGVIIGRTVSQPALCQAVPGLAHVPRRLSFSRTPNRLSPARLVRKIAATRGEASPWMAGATEK